MNLTLFERLPPSDQLVLTQGHILLKSRQPMTITQKRLLSLGVAIQRRADVSLRKPRIYTHDFARLFGLGGNSVHKTIADGTRGLLDLKVFLEMGEGSFRGYNWVTEAAYIGQRRSETNLAYAEFAFNPVLQEFLLNLEGRFQSYALLETSGITRVASWRLYEILLADTFGFNRTRALVKYDLEQLQYLLDVPGMSWRDFRRVLFERAQEDHAQETGLRWTYERLTHGRKVVGVEIRILEAPTRQKRDVPQEGPEGVSAEELNLMTLRNELLEIGFTYDPAKYVKELGVELARDILKRCLKEKRERDRTSGAVPITNLAGYVHERFKQALSHPPQVLSTPSQASTLAEKTIVSEREIDQLAASLLVTIRNARREHALLLYDTLPRPTLERIKDTMEAELEPIMLELFKAKGWEREAIITSWTFFALRLFPEHFPSHLHSVRNLVEAQGSLDALGEAERERVLNKVEESEG